MTQETVYIHNQDVVCRMIGKEAVLVPVMKKLSDDASLFSLNTTAVLVWTLINGKNTVHEIIVEFSKLMNISEDKTKNDVLELLNELLNASLILEIK